MTKLPIPLEALEDCGAILGRRGAGKSATKTLFFEHELDRGRRCCLIDPKGDSWGIRLNADGTPSRFQSVYIFGGEHADMALTDTMGATLGELIASHDLSCIVDLSSFSVAGMRRFMRDFAESLFEHNRAPLTLFVDEADQLAPQTVPADMAKLLHQMERLIRQGRQRGVFMWMLTQRPQVLNKNLLSQAETLIAMKMTTPHDRGAIRDWMEAHDPALARDVEKTLSKLSVGEAWVWVPAADFLERVQFPLFSTFDSGRTPRHGEVIQQVQLAPIDLSAIHAALAEPEPVPADPAAAYSAGTEAGLALKDRDEKIESQRIVSANLQRRLADALTELEYWQDRAQLRLTMIERARVALGQSDEIAAPAEARTGEEPGSSTKGGEHVESSAARAPSVKTEPPVPTRKGPRGSEREAGIEPPAAGGSPSPAATAIAALLDRINPARITWSQAAAMTGRKASGGNFHAARKWLRGSGRLIEEGEIIRSSGEAPDGMYREEAIALWKSVLTNPAPKMIDAFVDYGSLTKEQLGAAIGAQPRGGNFNNGLSQLRRNGLLQDAGGVLSLADPLPGEAP